MIFMKINMMSGYDNEIGEEEVVMVVIMKVSILQSRKNERLSNLLRVAWLNEKPS